MTKASPRQMEIVRPGLVSRGAWCVLAFVLLALASWPSVRVTAQAAAQQPAASAVEAPVNGKTWIGHYQEYEEFLKAAEIDRVENVPIGVTKPQRAYFKLGGLCESAAWKPLKPGMQRGYWESYKAEIGAYEVDKLLGLDMVPPAVERKVAGKLGAAIFWVTLARTWKMGDSGPPQSPHWSRQVVRMKMFDDLIGNIDRNAGNLLVDPSWNLVLIDHSRALTDDKKLPTVLSRIDRELWEKMNALTIDSLTAALGPWLGKSEIRAVLERRTEMGKAIDELVKVKGEAVVFLPSPPPPSPGS